MSTAAPLPLRGGRAIARNLGWLLASRGATAVLSLVYLAIVTRTLGVFNFGRFSLVVGASQALATFVAFQTWQIIVQYGTGHLERRDTAALGRLLRACAVLDASSAAVGAVLAAIILTVWHEALGLSETLARAAMLYAAVQLLAIRSTPVGMLRLRDRFSLATIAEAVTPVARLIGAGVVALVHPTVQGFLVAWGLAELLTAAAFWALVGTTGDLALIRTRGATVARLKQENAGFVRFALGSNANVTLGLSGKQIPLLLAGAIAGPASAGAYRLAAQLAQGLTKLSQLVTRAAFPEIVRAAGSGGLDHLRQMFARSLLLSAAAAIIAFALFAALGRPVLALMGGKGFAEAYPVLLFLAAAGCVDLLTVGFEPMLTAAHRTGTTFAIRLAATIAMFATALLLAPVIGVEGVAAAVLANSVVAAALLGLAIAAISRQSRN